MLNEYRMVSLNDEYSFEEFYMHMDIVLEMIRERQNS